MSTEHLVKQNEDHEAAIADFKIAAEGPSTYISVRVAHIRTVLTALASTPAAQPDSERMRKAFDHEDELREMQEGFVNPVTQVALRAGFIMCREIMARFLEQGGDSAIAASIRANWLPQLGADPGGPRKLDFAEVCEAGDMENGPWNVRQIDASIEGAVYALAAMHQLGVATEALSRPLPVSEPLSPAELAECKAMFERPVSEPLKVPEGKVYEITIVHREDYSGEHREWTEQVTIPPAVVAKIQADALAASPTPPLEGEGK